MVHIKKNTLLKKKKLGFSGGSVVKNPPVNAGDMGSTPDPWSSHMSWSNWAHAPQPEKPPQWEGYVPQLESSPYLPQLEKSLCSNEDPAQPKVNK